MEFFLTFKFGSVKDEDKNKEKTIKIIKKSSGLKASEIADALNTSKRTIERILKQLKEEKIIEFKGPPKTGGYFKL